MQKQHLNSITIRVTPQGAILHACRPGEHVLTVDVSSWTPEEREHLVNGCRSMSDNLVFDKPVEPPTVEQLRTLVAESVRKDEAQLQKIRDATIDELLWSSSESWQVGRGDLCLKELTRRLRPDAVEEAQRRNDQISDYGQRQAQEIDPTSLIRHWGSNWEVLRTAVVVVECMGETFRVAVTVPENVRARAQHLLEQRELEAQQKLVRLEQEREDWIRQNGSPNLRRCFEEGIEHSDTLLTEYLAAQRPGWVWYDDVPWTSKAPRNPSNNAFAHLDQARIVDPRAELVYWEDDGRAGYAATIAVRVPGKSSERTAVLLVPEWNLDLDEDDDYYDY